MKQIFDIFKNNNYAIRKVGGVVRDVYLNNIPKDIDFATNALPETIMELGKKNNITVIPTGLHHGTVTWVIDNEWYEITTLRIDTNCDGRHADVEFTSDWKKDAERRDFTFNAMSQDEEGNIFDYFNGKDDLNNKIVRFVGNAEKRIKEDYLRILRAFRFSSRYNFEIADLEAIKNNVSGLLTISKERIWNEMRKIFSSDNWFETAKVMNEIKIFDLFNLSFNEKFTKVERDLFRMSRVFNNTDVPKMFKGSMIENKEYNFYKTVNDSWNNFHEIRVLRSRGISDFWLKNTNFGDFDFDEDIPVFPLNGEIMENHGFVQGIKMGKFLKKARIDWENSEFKMTEKDFFNDV